MNSSKRSIISASDEELANWLASVGEPTYRAGQIHKAIVSRRISDFDQMTDLPASLREKLADNWRIFSSTILRESSDDDRTRKLLLGFDDQKSVECVLLVAEDRRTLCMSTQVGCGMGCVFCASGLAGLERNLTPAEMKEQFLQVQRLLDKSERLSHVVVMGMGEPLANLESLLEVLDWATSTKGLGISGRHVTISTVGLPAKIDRLAAAGRPYHLAVSLHAPNDLLRQRIVPTAEKVTLAEILAAADRYRKTTGRQVTFEYVLLSDLNDRPGDARELAKLLAGRDAMINLIPYNPVTGLPFGTPTSERRAEFVSILRESGFTVKIRKRRGKGIDAACGQLRRQAMTDLIDIKPAPAS